MDFKGKIKHIKLQEIVAVRPGASLRETLEKMRKTRKGAVVVTKGNGRAAGIFTERDYLMKVLGMDVNLDSKIEEFMTANPITLNERDTVATAISTMADNGLRHIPIHNESEHFVGLLSVRNLVDYLVEFYPQEVINLPPRLHQTPLTAEGG